MTVHPLVITTKVIAFFSLSHANRMSRGAFHKCSASASFHLRRGPDSLRTFDSKVTALENVRSGDPATFAATLAATAHDTRSWLGCVAYCRTWCVAQADRGVHHAPPDRECCPPTALLGALPRRRPPETQRAFLVRPVRRRSGAARDSDGAVG